MSIRCPCMSFAVRLSVAAGCFLYFGLRVPLLEAQIPERINYQGRLLHGTNLVNGTVSMRFNLYTSEPAVLLSFQSTGIVTVVDGLYSTLIGEHVTFGSLPDVLTNAEVWLEVVVNGVELSPRERIQSTAYAIVAGGVKPAGITEGMIATGAVQGVHVAAGAISSVQLVDGTISNADLASNSVTSSTIENGSIVNADISAGAAILASKIAATSFWEVAGNAGTVPGTHFVGTSDNQPLEIRVNSARVLRMSETGGVPLLTGGHASNSIAGTSQGAVIAGGGNSSERQQVFDNSTYSIIGGGSGNQVGDRWAVIGGGRGNSISTLDFSSTMDYGVIAGGMSNRIGYPVYPGHMAFIGGGCYNDIGASYAVVVGGMSNNAFGFGAAIGGGMDNTGSGDYASVGGGTWNSASGEGASVGGGTLNRTVSDYATVGGGFSNVVAGTGSTAGGGIGNTVGQSYSAIGGGKGNSVDGFSTTIAGGENNTIGVSQQSTIGGGRGNQIQDYAMRSTIAGGADNLIGPCDFSFIGGGSDNQIIGGGDDNTIAGGLWNIISGTAGAIGGGSQNSASNWYSTVPGGYQNVAAASRSFAAGNMARAIHDGAFVWSDSRGTAFSSVTSNEFAIAASNGVRIADNLSTNKLDRFGRYYRDNAVQAWAVVAQSGQLLSGFGITSVTNVSRGVYNIFFDASAAQGTSLCPVVSPEIDAAPTNASMLRFASVNAIASSNRFVQVFVNNGLGNLTNNNFNIVLTGR